MQPCFEIETAKIDKMKAEPGPIISIFMKLRLQRKYMQIKCNLCKQGNKISN